MHEEISLSTDKKKYTGWKSLSVSKSLGSICGTFQATYADRFTRIAGIAGLTGDRYWDLDIGAIVKIKVGNKPVFLGMAEQFTNAYGPASHALSIQGRSILADLVDCSHVGGSNEYLNVDILKVCEYLLWAWNDEYPWTRVKLSTRVPPNINDIFPTVTIQQGDSIFSAISKMCKQRGVIPISYGDEVLILTTPGDATSKDALISGVPALAAWKDIGHTIQNGSINESNVDRFRQYVVKGQMSGHDPASTSEGLDAVTGPSGEAWDYGIKRVKPTVLMMEDPANAAECKRRAEWESMNRAGKSRKCNYTIQGWTQRNGDPWQVNTLISVKDEIGGIYGTYLIDALKHVYSEKTGSRTTLSLVHPDTYEMPDETKKPENITGTYDPLTPEPGGA